MPIRILPLALSLGAFSIGTDGFVISGLLNRIAADFEVSTTAPGNWSRSSHCSTRSARRSSPPSPQGCFRVPTAAPV